MAKEIIISIIMLLMTGFIALQFKSFKEWLVWGVTEAESYLGSGTGQLKLKYVYNLAITRFPLITKLISFNMFSKLVDFSLIRMREMLENNEMIKKALETDNLLLKLL